jgi:hypothetical protein
MDDYPISQKHCGGIPESPLLQEVLEENEEIKEEWLVPTDYDHPLDDDDTEPKVEAGD